MGQMRPVVGDVADLLVDPLPGEYDRSGPDVLLPISANIYNKGFGTATRRYKKPLMNGRATHRVLYPK